MATKRLTKKQKAALETARNAEREANFAAFEAFKAKFDGLVFKAEVRWFDKSSGEGSVRGLNGEGSWTLYACNIKGTKTWFANTACVHYAKGQIIDAEVKVSYGCSLLVTHTPGLFDAVKWGLLDQKNLAFKCNEQGEATSGLFAEGA